MRQNHQVQQFPIKVIILALCLAIVLLIVIIIIMSDDNSWITTESLELSKGIVKGEEKLNTNGINYDKNIMTVDSIIVDILLRV